MAICKEIINLHDGDIGCVTFNDPSLGQKGKGCEFYFTVPFEVSSALPPRGYSDRSVYFADSLSKIGFSSSVFVKIEGGVVKANDETSMQLPVDDYSSSVVNNIVGLTKSISHQALEEVNIRFNKCYHHSK